MDQIRRKLSKPAKKNMIEKPKNKPDKFKLSLAALLIIAIATGGYFYYRYQQASKDPQSQLERKNSTETKAVVDSLSKILLLPTDKQPTVAKVEDTEMLKKSNAVFYEHVQTDDYLIFYPDRAIIFRKKENKIINIAPIIDASQSTQAETVEDSQN